MLRPSLSRDPSPRDAGAELRSRPEDTVTSGTDCAGAKGEVPDFARLLAPPLSPDELGWLAHYRILKVLGHGGMGLVFEAEDTHLQRLVALKIMLPGLADSPVARERFLREARAGAALKNDHIVTTYQVGQDRDIPFLASELLQGETLETRLRRVGSFGSSEVVRIALEIADGLSAAHARGLVHRDIKPANIWLEAPNDRVKILDFGLARPTGAHSSLTQAGGVVGTPEYMSPEQARGEEVDARSDLFSLGAILYVLCSGQKPFQGKSVMAVLTALAVHTPPPIRELNPEVPPGLAELIERLLEKDPALRPSSAEAVKDLLRAIEQGGGRAASTTSVISAEICHSGSAKPPLVAPARSMPRWSIAVSVVAVSLLAGIVFCVGRPEAAPGDNSASTPAPPQGPPLRIGVLHSRTGTMAVSERPVIDTVLLAVDEINERGGLLGRPVEAILADGQSDETVFPVQAEKLIQEDHVCTIFGCWTSASRKAVVPVVERHDHLMIYPVQYEGMESSPNVAYLGPVPNQQILPALRWLVGFESKKRWFLVGSDYVFPATANAVIRDEAKAKGCEVVGEEYLLLGSTEVGGVIERMRKSRPDLIVNTVNGDTNVAFFRSLRRHGTALENVPVLSFSISEQELSALAPREIAGDYAAGNYFQSLDTPQNKEFLSRFARRYGAERVVSSAMQTAYAGVHLWSQAVQAAGTDDVRAIRAALKGQKYDAPQGPVRTDPHSLHTVQIARVGRIDASGQLLEVYASPHPIAPEPFPTSRSPDEWLEFLAGLHQRWGGRWSNADR